MVARRFQGLSNFRCSAIEWITLTDLAIAALLSPNFRDRLIRVFANFTALLRDLSRPGWRVPGDFANAGPISVDSPPGNGLHVRVHLFGKAGQNRVLLFGRCLPPA